MLSAAVVIGAVRVNNTQFEKCDPFGHLIGLIQSSQYQ